MDEWIQEAREDLIAGDTETAFARFATAYDERKRQPEGKEGIRNASTTTDSP